MTVRGWGVRWVGREWRNAVCMVVASVWIVEVREVIRVEGRLFIEGICWVVVVVWWVVVEVEGNLGEMNQRDFPSLALVVEREDMGYLLRGGKGRGEGVRHPMFLGGEGRRCDSAEAR